MGHEFAHLGSGVAAVGDDALDEGKAPPRLPQKSLGAVAILDTGGVAVDVQQQTLRVDKDMALAAENLFPGIVARWVERAPPFTAPLPCPTGSRLMALVTLFKCSATAQLGGRRDSSASTSPRFSWAK